MNTQCSYISEDETRADVRLLAQQVKATSTLPFIAKLHSWRCTLQARISAYSARLEILGLQDVAVFPEQKKLVHRQKCEAETQVLYNEAEANPVLLDAAESLIEPEEDDEAGADMEPMSAGGNIHEPEHTIIWLPHRDSSSSLELHRAEMEVQHAHAVEQITVIRSCIGEKSVLIQIRVRRSKKLGQHRKGRNWQDINKAHSTMVAALATYNRCRNALQQLSPNVEDMDIACKSLRPIEKDDLKELKDITEANCVGQRNDTVAWFWGQLAKDKGDEQYLTEGRVNSDFWIHVVLMQLQCVE